MTQVTITQILREWPPGYGGVERVAHELASAWGGTVYSLDAQRHSALGLIRCRCPISVCVCPAPRLLAFGAALPSPALWQLLRSKNPLHGHLPSPGVLLVLLLALLTRPHRSVTAHCIVS